jgi:stringent starvation protein B
MPWGMNDESRRLPPKREVALALLEGASLFIHLDPRRAGAVVPKWFTNQPQLVLQVGLNMPIAIPDLTVDEDGVSCTLSFNRSPFWCQLPWGAIYALVGEDGRGMIWPNDVPAEVAAQMQKDPAPVAPDAPQAKSARKGARSKLVAVSDEPRPEKPTRQRKTDAKPAKAVEPEPALAAVPTPALAPRPVPALAPERSGERESPASRSPASKKPKRELPPYLRVVK